MTIEEQDLPGIRDPRIREWVLNDHGDEGTDARLRVDDRVDFRSVVLLGSHGTEVRVELSETREIAGIERDGNPSFDKRPDDGEG